MILLPVLQGVYTFCGMVCNIQWGKLYYPQSRRVCKLSVIWFVISKGRHDITPNVAEGLPTLIWFIISNGEMISLPM